MEKSKSFDAYILQINKVAMDFLHSSDLENALKQLKLAEKILIDNKISKGDSLWGITYNNLGCFYKKVSNLKAALFYLTKALDVELATYFDATNIASTHLNLSAILSSLGDHKNSLIHALAALKTLQSSNIKSLNNSISTVISYHSIGLESEFLRKHSESTSAYKRGWEIAVKKLGPSHKLTESLRRSFVRVSAVPTMPIIKPQKKNIRKKQLSMDQNRLPKIVGRVSHKNSISSPREGNQINLDPKTSFHKVNARRSLSPLSSKSRNKFNSDLESINKLITELDGASQRSRLKMQKNTYQFHLASIIMIQKHWRGYATRKGIKSLKHAFSKNHSPQFSSIKKQAFNKVSLLKPIPEIKFENKMDAILKIQSWYRMISIREKYKSMQKAAIAIQKFIKGRNVKKLYLLVIDAAIFIQSVFRGYMVRKFLIKNKSNNRIELKT